MQNPYDYIKPIKDEKKFADRRNELKEMEYVPDVWESVVLQVQKMKEYKIIFDSLSDKEKSFIIDFVEIGSSVDPTSLAKYF